MTRPQSLGLDIVQHTTRDASHRHFLVNASRVMTLAPRSMVVAM
jgi:hypothetical protein